MSDSTSANLPTPGGGAPSTGFKVANVPKVTYQDPQSISTNYGWGLPVDFVLPRTIGKVIDMVLQIDITVTGEGASVALPPTPYWFERLEASLGGSAPIETVNKDELYQESLCYLDMQDFQTIAPKVNINPDGSWVTSNTSFPVGTYRFFLPLWANCLMTMQPYLKGFNSEWKLRFTTSLTPPILGSVASPAVAISGLRLLITEAQLPPSIETRLAAQHSKGVTYNTINRLRHTDTKMPTGAGTIEYTLTTFGNDSAGVLLYFRGQDNDYTHLGLRCPLNTINMRDAQGNPYYATDLDGQFNLYFLSPWSIKGEPLAGNRGAFNYLLPFSSHVGAVLEDGRDLGAYSMSGKEKAVLNLTNADLSALTANCGANPVFVAVSYDYMRIKVKNGNARVYYNRD